MSCGRTQRPPISAKWEARGIRPPWRSEDRELRMLKPPHRVQKGGFRPSLLFLCRLASAPACRRDWGDLSAARGPAECCPPLRRTPQVNVKYKACWDLRLRADFRL